MTLLKNGMKTKIRSLRVGLIKPVEIVEPGTPSLPDGFPEEPSAFNTLETVTVSQTWTAPADGFYKIEAHGASGDGGNGMSSVTVYAAGDGGGGGGYACSVVALKKGDTVEIVPGSVGKDTTVIINSSIITYPQITITSGSTGGGYTTTSSDYIPGGNGGSAFGGNVSNINGSDGKKGGSGSYSSAGGTGGAPGHVDGNTGGKGGGTVGGVGSPGSAGFVNLAIGDNVSLFPEEPTAYNILETVTASGTWTAPADGWYEIVAVGASGDGGKSNIQDFGDSCTVATGGGGGSGGVAVSRVRLNSGDKVTISIGNTGNITTAVIDSQIDGSITMSANSGNSGGNATTSKAGSGGTGGTASGGKYLNLTGNDGSNGSRVSKSRTSFSVAGGSGGITHITGGAKGGDGQGENMSFSYSNESYTGQFTSPGKGGPGVVIISAGNTNN